MLRLIRLQTVPPNNAFISGRCEMKSFILIFSDIFFFLPLISFRSLLPSHHLSLFLLFCCCCLLVPRVINRNVYVLYTPLYYLPRSKMHTYKFIFHLLNIVTICIFVSNALPFSIFFFSLSLFLLFHIVFAAVWFTVVYQKRFKKERKARIRMQQQLDAEMKRRNQIEDALKASGAPAETIRLLSG